MNPFKNLITFFQNADTPAAYKAMVAGVGIGIRSFGL